LRCTEREALATAFPQVQAAIQKTLHPLAVTWLLSPAEIVYAQGMTEEHEPSDTNNRKLTAKAQLAREQALRKERLAKQLRTNLQRRKVQGRARREGEEDQRKDGLQTSPEEGLADSDNAAQD
jgi:hypothetical protein